MPAKQAVTISDVARQAGLSVATVSRALNRSPKLDPQTAKRVFEAVEQLGYNAAPITGRATERSRMREKCYTVEVILSPPPDAASSSTMPTGRRQRWRSPKRSCGKLTYSFILMSSYFNAHQKRSIFALSKHRPRPSMLI